MDPKKIPEGEHSARYLMKVWSKFRVYLRRRYGKVKYFWVLERHKSGIYHMHVLFDRYIPQDWISDNFSRLGGGEVAWIKYLDEQRTVGYMTKYLTKSLGRELEPRLEIRIKR